LICLEPDLIGDEKRTIRGFTQVQESSVAPDLDTNRLTHCTVDGGPFSASENFKLKRSSDH